MTNLWKVVAYTGSQSIDPQRYEVRKIIIHRLGIKYIQTTTR
jgi:hypothetical protein